MVFGQGRKVSEGICRWVSPSGLGKAQSAKCLPNAHRDLALNPGTSSANCGGYSCNPSIQEVQKFKVILSFVVSLESAEATLDLVLGRGVLPIIRMATREGASGA